MNDSAPISSNCSECGMERVQPGYSREELLQLLDAGAEIKRTAATVTRSGPFPSDRFHRRENHISRSLTRN
jgi:hypothetical protein